MSKISVFYSGGNGMANPQQLELDLAAVDYMRSMRGPQSQHNTCVAFKTDHPPFEAGHVIWLKETLAEIRTKALAANIPLGLVPIDMAYENDALNPKAWSPEIAAIREKWEKRKEEVQGIK